MKIKATTPCYKFRDATPEEQIAKIKEEQRLKWYE